MGRVDRDILLLAGTTEARRIARALPKGRLQVVMSEPPRGADPMPVPFEVIGAPDAARLTSAMSGKRAVVDASHGFDGAMTAAGFAAATDAGVPFVSLSRAVWDLGPNVNWQRAKDVRAAIDLVPAGARVFSAAGWDSLAECADFAGESLMLRQTQAHARAVPYGFVKLVFGKAPFSKESETALFEALQVDTLIARNLGGAASRPKVEAAMEMGLRVILIDRPPLPQGAQVVGSVEDALAWVAAL